MTISSRATAGIAQMPEREQPLSEQYRIVAKEWVSAEAGAQLLEDLKTTKLEQKKQALIDTEGPMPDSHAERRVKAGIEWEEYIREIVDAREKANFAKVKMDYIKMRFNEWQAKDATARAEMKMIR